MGEDLPAAIMAFSSMPTNFNMVTWLAASSSMTMEMCLAPIVSQRGRWENCIPSRPVLIARNIAVSHVHRIPGQRLQDSGDLIILAQRVATQIWRFVSPHSPSVGRLTLQCDVRIQAIVKYNSAAVVFEETNCFLC